MKLNKIKITNFLSIKNIELKFVSTNGLLLVEGKNLDANGSSGSGKSSIFEAIYWVLTGKTLRKSTEETLINGEEKKGLKVELEAQGFRIVRSKKPTKLDFFVGTDCLTKASAIETQACIDSFLGTNYKLLAASMFLGQHNDLTFLDATADEKRVIIRNFLNLDDLFKKRDKIRDLKADFLAKSREIEASVNQLNTQIGINQNKLSEIDSNKKLLKEFEGVEVTLEEILSQEEHNRKNDLRAKDIQKEIDNLNSKSKDLKLKKEQGEEICSKCNRALDPVSKEVKIQKDRDIEDKLADLSYKVIDLTLEYANKQYFDIPIKSSDFTKYNEYKKLLASEEIFKETIRSIELQIRDLDLQRQKSLEFYDVMKFWEKAFSEHGVIKYIIRNILSYFKDRSNYYLSLLTNSKYFIEFDEELNEKISTNGISIHYISLSGGEKRKVNLSVLLALKDLLTITNKSPSNLLFFDEITDSIDDYSMGNVVALLNELKKDKLIFLITHNKTLKELLSSCRKIKIHKKDNESFLAK